MIVKQIDDKTRIIEKRSFIDFGNKTVRLQRKRGWFWITTSWLYTNQLGSIDEYYNWFLLDEKRRENEYGNSQFSKPKYVPPISSRDPRDRGNSNIRPL